MAIITFEHNIGSSLALVFIENGKPIYRLHMPYSQFNSSPVYYLSEYYKLATGQYAYIVYDNWSILYFVPATNTVYFRYIIKCGKNGTEFRHITLIWDKSFWEYIYNEVCGIVKHKLPVYVPFKRYYMTRVLHRLHKKYKYMDLAYLRDKLNIPAIVE